MTLDRRAFLHDAALGAAMLTLWQLGCAKEKSYGTPDGGPICKRGPANGQDEIMLALAETVVPGYATDPSGAPGAAQTCVLDLLDDERYPAKGFVPLIAGVLEQKSKQLFDGKGFAVLGSDARMQVTIAVAADLPPVTWFYKFIRSAYYTDDSTWLGLDYFGYRRPPEGKGWRDDPAFSLRRPIGREMTGTGNLP